MEKCFYHTAYDAVSACLGCKMPICQACKEEGQNGFCDRCLKKVAALGQSVQDTKKTGVVGNQKATMLKSARSAMPQDVTACFHHFDAPAVANCPTCNRPFCAGCLNPEGLCSHCEALTAAPAGAGEPATPASRPAARRPVAATSASTALAVAPASDASKLIMLAVVAVIVLLGVGWALHHATHHAGAPHSQSVLSSSAVAGR